MQYDADFGGPDGLPMDHVIFGAEPTFWLIGLLLVAAAATLGWWLGVGAGRRSDTDAAERIWDDVHDAIKAAMKASSHDLPGRVARLNQLIDSRLGQTRKLASGVAGPLDALGRALDGKPPHPAHLAHDEAHAAEPRGGHGDGDHDAPATSAVNTRITIITGGDHGQAAPGHAPEGHETGSLSPRERNAALRGALDDLHDHWSVRGARLDELRAAGDELWGAGLSRDRPRSSHDH
jgi:hypothetical protein